MKMLDSGDVSDHPYQTSSRRSSMHYENGKEMPHDQLRGCIRDPRVIAA
jgi:hypothetical protein